MGSSPTATRTSESVGAPSGSETGVMLMGRGSPGEVLRAYSTSCSAIWGSIVWKHGCTSTSVAARYHPLRCRYASWTLPPQSSALIASPTCLVRAVRSDWREFQITLFMRQPPARHSHPVQCSIVQLPTNLHVSRDIQSLRGWCFRSGWTSDAFSSSNVCGVRRR